MDTESIKEEMKKGDPVSFNITGQDNALMKAHEMAMSRDEQIACMGRVLKTMLNAFEQIVSEETKRQTRPGIIMDGIMSGAATFITTAVELFAIREERIPAIIETSTVIAEACVTAMLGNLRDEAAASKQQAAAE